MIYIIIIIFSVILFLLISKISKKYDLVDYPDGNRKTHTTPTPYTGGIAIYLSFLLVIALKNFCSELEYLIILSCSIIGLGFLDDKYKLSVKNRIIFQIICIVLPISKGFLITNIGLVEPFGIINLGTFSYIYTIISVAILMNGFNYIDGKDGLASSLFINSIFLIMIFLFLEKKEINEILTFCFIITFIFILFNLELFRLPKLFLGDNGSLFLGYILSFLLIYLSQNKNYIKPALLIWSISFVVFEFFSTNLQRLIKKQNPFKPGNDHIHAYLEKKIGLYKTLVTINFLNIFFAGLGYYAYYNFNNTSSLILFIFLFMVYFLLRIKFIVK